MFSQLPMISKLLFVILILFILQALGGYYQVKNYRATVREIHKLGNVGIGQKKGKFFNGNIVMVASDSDGIIKGVVILDGITFLSKFHSVDEFLGKPLVGSSIIMCRRKRKKICYTKCRNINTSTINWWWWIIWPSNRN